MENLPCLLEYYLVIKNKKINYLILNQLGLYLTALMTYYYYKANQGHDLYLYIFPINSALGLTAHTPNPNEDLLGRLWKNRVVGSLA